MEMVKVLTRELMREGLNWAVAKCEGYQSVYTNGSLSPVFRKGEAVKDTWPEYSTDPAQAWLIIHRERINISFNRDLRDRNGTYVHAETQTNMYHGYSRGHDFPFDAGLRCFVASKLGEQVEIPVAIYDAMNRSAPGYHALNEQESAAQPAPSC